MAGLWGLIRDFAFPLAAFFAYRHIKRRRLRKILSPVEVESQPINDIPLQSRGASADAGGSSHGASDAHTANSLRGDSGAIKEKKKEPEIPQIVEHGPIPPSYQEATAHPPTPQQAPTRENMDQFNTLMVVPEPAKVKKKKKSKKASATPIIELNGGTLDLEPPRENRNGTLASDSARSGNSVTSGDVDLGQDDSEEALRRRNSADASAENHTESAADAGAREESRKRKGKEVLHVDVDFGGTLDSLQPPKGR